MDSLISASAGRMNSASQPLVSIVTPMYNEVRFIAECIESVIAQTYQNWDYTIIDNCSTDGSLEVARRYAAKDQRIRVHQNQHFLGVIQNHNVALRQISPKSKYCKVVLGDDWIFSNCLEQMVALAESHPSIGIVGAYALEGQRVAWAGLPYPSSLVDGREICRRHLLEGLYVFGSANAVLYRADLVRSRDSFYNEANIHADTEACFALLKNCDFGFVHQVLTFTRVRPGSLTDASNDLATNLSCLLQVLTKHAPEYMTSEECEARLARHLAEYYKVLGRSLILRRNRQYWDYHRNEFIKAGIVLNRIRVVKGAFETLCDVALNPKDTVEKLLLHKRKLRVSRQIQDPFDKTRYVEQRVTRKQESI
jgi:glycosyltransferase involved in cell wall biosynthesis